VQHHCTEIIIYRNLWSHSFFTYTVHDQALQLQNKHRHNIPLLPFCNITYHHNYTQCTTAVWCYMCNILPTLNITFITLNYIWEFQQFRQQNQFSFKR
jgi:hypothetical protein